MTRFQHFAAQLVDGPHVTLAAGVEMAGYHWSTTSAAAAKVRAVRARPHAAVLAIAAQAHDEQADDEQADDEQGIAAQGIAAQADTEHADDEQAIDDGADDVDARRGGQPWGWTLIAGRAQVLDVRRPRDGLADPVAAGLAGIAVARIGLAHCDQLTGYLHVADDIPKRWRPAARVLLVVRAEHRLMWRAGALVEATGAFVDTAPLPTATRRRTRRPAPTLVAGLSAPQARLVARPGPCALGLSTSLGPLVVPAAWDPDTGTVRLERSLLAHLRAEIPGPCSITFDHSPGARPATKIGVMLRGHVELLADGPHDRPHDRGPTSVEHAVLAVRAGRVTAWSGFSTSTTTAR
ncbi:MAG: hypothetical protein JWM12_1654 [Ilumatobacteraceae bacterium]|nr:hypothetical protein [Ilumatobacteraceae bacterium]